MFQCACNRPPVVTPSSSLATPRHLLALARAKNYDSIDATAGRVEPLLSLGSRSLAAAQDDAAAAEALSLAPEAEPAAAPTDVVMTVSGVGDGEAVTAEAAAAAILAAEGLNLPPSGAEESPSREAIQRAGKELRGLMREPHPNVTIFPSPNLLFWRVVIEGPTGTVRPSVCAQTMLRLRTHDFTGSLSLSLSGLRSTPLMAGLCGRCLARLRQVFF